jgi:hypothetical protein
MRTVVPGQRSLVQSSIGGRSWPAITVSSLRIESVRPAGNSRATIHFTVRATARSDGMDFPVLPQGPGAAPWLVAIESVGHWYVDLTQSTAQPFGVNS